MNQRLRKRLSGTGDAGFTLIELLIVIVILGVLAAIVVFAIGSTRGDSVSASCKTDVKSVQLSAEAVKTKTGKYPAAQSDLIATSTNGALLKNMPGGTTAADDYFFTYTSATPFTTYTLAVAGASVVGTDPTATPARPHLTDTATNALVNGACTPK